MKITLKIFTLLCSGLITSNGYSMNQVFNNNNNMMVNNINNKENNDQRKMKQAMINIVNDPFRQHAGLQNIGATCYMNATIQAIVSNPKACFYLLQDVYENYNNLLQNNTAGWLTIQFANVIAELWGSTPPNASSTCPCGWYAPHAFKNILGMVNPLFLGVAANDAKDLLLCFYENMHNVLNTPPNKIMMQGNNAYANFVNDYFSKNKSTILDQFYFIQGSHMICNKCKHDTDNYQTYNMLIFPLEKVRLMKANNNDTTPVTIMDCFKLNENQETFVGENQIYCNNCKQNADATAYNEIDYSPNILSIVLNRGKGLEFDVETKIEDQLDLKDYVTNSKDDSKYFLHAIICHSGESGMGGHFVTISRPSSDKPWVLYNDAQVIELTKKDINDILKGKGFIPYVVFYTKNEHDANSILNKQQHYFNKINNMKIKSMMPSNMMMPGMWNNMSNNMMWSNMMWNNMNMMNNMNRNMMLNNMNMNMGMNMVNNNMQKFNNFNNPKMNNFNNNNMVKGMNMHNNIAMNNNFNMNNNMQQNNFHQNMMRNNMN